jgi:hypothetical protein
MNILFDHCTPKPLRKHLRPHTVKTTLEMGWDGLANGDLLREAQTQFDVLLTTDSNIKYQQSVHQYDIGLIVLRALSDAPSDLLELVPALLELLTKIQPGEVHYLFTAEMQALEARRRRQFKR